MSINLMSAFNPSFVFAIWVETGTEMGNWDLNLYSPIYPGECQVSAKYSPKMLGFALG